MVARRGVSLVEILIVIGIMGLLIQLALPAIQRSREAARRVQCADHLRQIGLAVQSFHGAQNAFPRSRQRCNHGTWVTELWPYLDRADLADRWDPARSYHAQPLDVIRTCVPIMFCPTRRSPPALSRPGEDDRGPATGRSGALGDYAANIGDGTLPGDEDSLGANGVFVSRAMRLADCKGTDPEFIYEGEPFYTSYKSITDGTSKTLLIGEKGVTEWGHGYRIVPPSALMYDNSVYNPDDNFTVGRLAGPDFGLHDGNFGRDFGSDHSGICQFVFADGSLHTLANGMDPVTLGHLANRSDGLTPEAP